MPNPHPYVPLIAETIPLYEQLDQAYLDRAAAQDAAAKIAARNQIGGLSAKLWTIGRDARQNRSTPTTPKS